MVRVGKERPVGMFLDTTGMKKERAAFGSTGYTIQEMWPGGMRMATIGMSDAPTML